MAAGRKNFIFFLCPLDGVRFRLSAQCAASLACSGCPEPSRRAMRILTPTDTRVNAEIRRLMRDVVAPTAARQSLPAKRPTTMISAALNSNWNTPVAATGSAKRTTGANGAPCRNGISLECAMRLEDLHIADIFVVLLCVDLDLAVQNADEIVIAQLAQELADGDARTADENAQLVVAVLMVQLIPRAVDKCGLVDLGADGA